MAGRVQDGSAGQSGLAGYAATGLGNPSQGPSVSAAAWTYILAGVALVFLILVHFRIGFRASAGR